MEGQDLFYCKYSIVQPPARIQAVTCENLPLVEEISNWAPIPKW